MNQPQQKHVDSARLIELPYTAPSCAHYKDEEVLQMGWQQSECFQCMSVKKKKKKT